MPVFINRPEDLQWLRETHLKPGNVDYSASHRTAAGVELKAAMVFGNEDCPRRIEVYFTAEPNLKERGRAFLLVEQEGHPWQGKYQEQYVDCYAGEIEQ